MIVGIAVGVAVVIALVATPFILSARHLPSLNIGLPGLTADSDRELAPVTQPSGYYPLTGLPFYLEPNDDEALLAAQAAAIIHSRPVNVKIENSYEARPQYGLSRADVVYETLAEGGITRFNCVFQSNLTEEVGPVRSARNSDISVVPQYQGVLFYSGANDEVRYQLSYAPFPSFIEGEEGFYRVDFRYAPHDLFYSLPQAYTVIQENGYEISLAYPPTFEFLKLSSPQEAAMATVVGATAPEFSPDTVNPPATPVSQLIVPFSTGFENEWTWTGEGLSGGWLRSQEGPSIEAIDDTQIKATNVVVLWAPHYYVAAGGGTYEIDLTGSGYASVFTQGGRIDGTWTTDGTTPPRFRDYNGEIIYLTPGNTWFQVLPLSSDIVAW